MKKENAEKEDAFSSEGYGILREGVVFCFILLLGASCDIRKDACRYVYRKSPKTKSNAL